MTNPYYNRVTNFIADTSVRSDDVDAELNAVVHGFDLLGDPTQIGNGGLMWGIDSGTANNYVYTNDADDEVDVGRLASFNPLNTNTGASVFSYNGGANAAIVRNDGTALQARDILEGVPLILLWDDDGGRWVIVGSTNEQTLAAFRPGGSTVTGTTHTLTATDEGCIILFTNAAAITVTAPNDSTEDLPDQFIAHLHQEGTGQITVSPGPGVTLRYADSAKTRARYSSLSIIKIAANTYKIIGDQEVA